MHHPTAQAEDQIITKIKLLYDITYYTVITTFNERMAKWFV